MNLPRRNPPIPICSRGAHYCGDLCPDADGLPCQADGWRPRTDGTRRGSARHNYRALRAALPGELSELQLRYLRWLAGWDAETTDVMVSLLRRGNPPP